MHSMLNVRFKQGLRGNSTLNCSFHNSFTFSFNTKKLVRKSS